ncbi:hypothetical protein evm_001013 [Chilo suppressalis]|nr:hypothetical protein evm_001013 [Chilo suppressalis]
MTGDIVSPVINKKVWWHPCRRLDLTKEASKTWKADLLSDRILISCPVTSKDHYSTLLQRPAKVALKFERVTYVFAWCIWTAAGSPLATSRCRYTLPCAHASVADVKPPSSDQQPDPLPLQPILGFSVRSVI